MRRSRSREADSGPLAALLEQLGPEAGSLHWHWSGRGGRAARPTAGSPPLLLTSPS